MPLLLDETPGRSRPARSSDPAVLLSVPGYDYGAGFLWSADGGADHHRMPASPATFLDWYPEWITGQMAR